jgi:hypothetical protein
VSHNTSNSSRGSSMLQHMQLFSGASFGTSMMATASGGSIREEAMG